MRMTTMTISGSLPPKEIGGLTGRTGLLEAAGRKADGHGCTLRLLRAQRTTDDVVSTQQPVVEKRRGSSRFGGPGFFAVSHVDTVSSQRV